MEVKFTKFDESTNWVSGKVNNGEFTFQAKLFDVDSEFGINGGRISKLAIQDENKDCIVNYDRGWDTKPKNKHKSIFDSVMKLLESSRKRFEE